VKFRRAAERARLVVAVSEQTGAIPRPLRRSWSRIRWCTRAARRLPQPLRPAGSRRWRSGSRSRPGSCCRGDHRGAEEPPPHRAGRGDASGRDAGGVGPVRPRTRARSRSRRARGDGGRFRLLSGIRHGELARSTGWRRCRVPSLFEVRAPHRRGAASGTHGVTTRGVSRGGRPGVCLRGPHDPEEFGCAGRDPGRPARRRRCAPPGWPTRAVQDEHIAADLLRVYARRPPARPGGGSGGERPPGAERKAGAQPPSCRPRPPRRARPCAAAAGRPTGRAAASAAGAGTAPVEGDPVRHGAQPERSSELAARARGAARRPPATGRRLAPEGRRPRPAPGETPSSATIRPAGSRPGGQGQRHPHGQRGGCAAGPPSRLLRRAGARPLHGGPPSRGPANPEASTPPRAAPAPAAHPPGRSQERRSQKARALAAAGAHHRAPPAGRGPGPPPAGGTSGAALGAQRGPGSSSRPARSARAQRGRRQHESAAPSDEGTAPPGVLR